MRLPAWRPCMVCGDDFMVSKYHPMQAYCSDPCRRKRLDPVWRVCEGCGLAYQAESQRVVKGEGLQYCSRECAFGDCEAWMASVRLGQEVAQRKQEKRAERERELGLPRTCMVCESDYLPRSLNQKYCSPACRDERSRQRAYERWLPNRQGQSYTRRTRTPATCIQCGERFLSDTGQRYCSSACYPQRARTNRHLRYVIRRDAARCQLCGERVDLSASVPDPKAPTVDHIVPRSLGGKDTKRNVHLAHFGCNARKGAGAVGEQMLCVG